MAGSGEKPTCGYIVYVVTVAIIIGGLITFLLWAFTLPDSPEFFVSGFEVSNFKLSPNSLTSDFSVSVAVRNPNNKFSVRYDDVHAAVLYSTGVPGDDVLNGNDFVIATKPTFLFSQRPQGVMQREVRLGTVGFRADEGRIRSGTAR
ncbi:NDR1/HIN1-like protein 12 [Asparagus officinalis]|uniref:NDR1/HIN1-like protein 12 n=1 Tax=Asparagus officinalis TaxID=4686 RepID=UPI00098E1881|nr:NDR1/HIN1-like protein 12 [Asparagus officinalis]